LRFNAGDCDLWELQAMLYEVLVSGPLLSEDEREVLRWGHNARVGQNTPKRLMQGKQLDIYKKATALECLVSFLGIFLRCNDLAL